jgi:hypothetical protein
MFLSSADLCKNNRRMGNHECTNNGHVNTFFEM